MQDPINLIIMHNYGGSVFLMLSLVVTWDYLRLLDMHFHVTCQLLNSTVSDKYRIST